MPLSNLLRKLVCFSVPLEEEAEPPARPLRPQPAQAGPAHAGRPYRDYVENETDRYWREMVKPRSLPKPDPRELRARAFYVRGMNMRRRQCLVPDPALAPYRAHQGLNAVHMYLVYEGFIKPTYSRLEASPGYLEALFQLQADAKWQPRELPLPAHRDPQHPAIYYYINDPVSKRPVPREDALLRGDYIYTQSGDRFVDDDHIPPWLGRASQPTVADLRSRKLKRCYSLNRTGDTLEIKIHWINDASRLRTSMMSIPLEKLRFSHPSLRYASAKQPLCRYWHHYGNLPAAPPRNGKSRRRRPGSRCGCPWKTSLWSWDGPIRRL